MTIRHKHQDIEAAKASAREASSRRTCEGCAFLRTHLRPMCQAEHGPHFRMTRDTYHERCGVYAVRGRDGKPVERKAEPPPPAPEKPKRMRLVEIRGEKRAVTEDEYDRLLARNAARRRA
jgi:hypothetical protein